MPEWFAGLDDGRIPNLDQVARVARSRVDGGPADGTRTIDVQMYRGFTVRLFPDRGLDIGAVTFEGTPLAWTSAVGEMAPLALPTGVEWNAAFGGGLVATCGLFNVGAPTREHGQHGGYSHRRASDVTVDRRRDGGDLRVVVTGRVDEATAIGPHLRLERRVEVVAGRGELRIDDVTTNLGYEPVPAPLLYHVNVGAPLWADDARLELPSVSVHPRDAESAPGVEAWNRPPEVQPAASEWVLEHEIAPGDDDWAWARLEQPSEDVVLRIGWDTTTLPRLHQWLHPAAGVYALGIEPANCSVLGRDADEADGRSPVLQAGERRCTSLRVLAERR